MKCMQYTAFSLKMKFECSTDCWVWFKKKCLVCDPLFRQLAINVFMVTFRGFVKYKRAKNQYRSPEERINDWDEIYNHKGVKKGIQVQAARSAIYFTNACDSVFAVFILVYSTVLQFEKYHELSHAALFLHNFEVAIPCSFCITLTMLVI
jgi:hypothetical protein